MVNLHYIRAAVLAATGENVSFDTLRRLLVEEGLLTQAQSDQAARDFVDYREFYHQDEYSRASGDADTEMGLPT